MKSAIAACLLLGAATAAHAQIGRLFTTPAEREQLDIARGLVAPPAPPAAAAPPEPQPVTVDGFVRRSSGKATVWINKEAQDGARKRFSGPAQAPRVTVTLPSGRTVSVKPGQTVDANAGTVTDVDEGRP
ncbi:hypothetical protein HF313_15330 [Massilia atriviolacea]|uniref:Uncharacterized protein n=1 Tax=Massilia atriviolacea TaxID=2495579 RepID=A0A430HRD1_9BURK|nr:hypothetical protein [Massilia atriviolacea]RSZ60085.1 hypothetical protein EJB06_07850 [Massilia atriviolacea]